MWQEGEGSEGWPSRIPTDLNLPLLIPARTLRMPLKLPPIMESAAGVELNLASLPHAYPGWRKYLLWLLGSQTLYPHSLLGAPLRLILKE